MKPIQVLNSFSNVFVLLFYILFLQIAEASIIFISQKSMTAHPFEHIVVQPKVIPVLFHTT